MKARDKHRYLPPEDLSTTVSLAPGNDGLDRYIQEALEQLPERERLAVQTFYLLDESSDRARSLLKLSKSGLYRVLQRARRRLKHLLKDYREDFP